MIVDGRCCSMYYTYFAVGDALVAPFSIYPCLLQLHPIVQPTSSPQAHRQYVITLKYRGVFSLWFSCTIRSAGHTKAQHI